jgi:L-ascorbate metabolism protein UlaG (beta-lactamase superfamily)
VPGQTRETWPKAANQKGPAYDPDMCLAEVCEGISRRRFLRTGAAALAAAPLFPGVLGGAERPAPGTGTGGRRPAGVGFTWFGTNGWKIEFTAGGSRRTILLDPWFARFDSGFFSGRPDPETPLAPADPSLVERHVPERVDHVLIGHGHWDHISDVPAVQRRSGAMVIGSETHWHLMRSFGLDDAKLVVVKGGEVLAFDGYTLEVFAGLHSLGPTKKYAFPGHLTADPAPPRTIGDLPEGDSLCYLLTIEDRFSVFLMSTANFVERSLAGLRRPDVAIVAAIFRDQVHAYASRLMELLGRPRVVLPTHWDNFERPYSEGAQDLRDVLGDAGRLDLFVQELRRASPGSRVVVLDFFESFLA